MGRWIRVDVTRQQHPRALTAGGWGMVVAEAVWEIAKAHDRNGTLPASYWRAEFLSKWSNFELERGGRKGIERGMRQAVAAGLLDILPDGSIKIHDWEQYQPDPRTGKRNADRKDIAQLRGDHPTRSEAIQFDPVRSSPIRSHPERSARQDRTGQEEEEEGASAPPPPGDQIPVPGIRTGKRGRPATHKDRPPPDPLAASLAKIYSTVHEERFGAPPPSPAIRYFARPAAYLRATYSQATDDEILAEVKRWLTERRTWPKVQFIGTDIAEIVREGA